MLAKSNKFECDTCGSHQEAQRAIKIRAAPACLILHLKRFKFIEQLRRCAWQRVYWHERGFRVACVCALA
jgi:ubiquitin C-terminal hydrolase